MKDRIVLILVLVLITIQILLEFYTIEQNKRHEENYNNIYMSINKLQEQFNNGITITIE